MFRQNLVFVVAVSLIASLQSAACEQQITSRHVNPDGSLGGLVSQDAKVSSTVYVGPNAKVCDEAWVEGNVKLLDHAIVKENSWIKGDVTLREGAEISGRATVKGIKSFVVDISGNAKAFGSASIGPGTRIQDNAKVYGEAFIEDSKILESARVCEKFIIRNRSIRDDYFCMQSIVKSDLSIAPANFSLEKFNGKLAQLVFSSDGNLSLDNLAFSVSLNGVIIDPSYIVLSRRNLRVSKAASLKDGLNEILITGKDEFGRQLQDQIFKFVSGDSQRVVELSDDVEESFKLSVTHDIAGESFRGSFRREGRMITLLNLPSNHVGLSVDIKGVGEDAVVAESFSSIEDINQSLEVIKIPAFENNVVDFSDGGQSWFKSHPDNVIYVPGPTPNLKILKDESARVVLAKTVELKDDLRSFLVNFSLSTALTSSAESDVEVILVNPSEKSLDLISYSSSEGGMKHFQNELITHSVNREKSGDRAVVIFRLQPSVSRAGVRNGMMIYPGSLENKSISLKIVNEGVWNLRRNIIPQVSDPDIACSDSRYLAGAIGWQTEKTWQDKRVFLFSAGLMDGMPKILENRISGTLKIKYLADQVIRNVELVGIQDGQVRFIAPMSRCAREAIVGRNARDFTFAYQRNIAKHLFEVDQFSMQNVSTYIGAKISFKVQVTFQNSKTGFTETHLSPVVETSPVLQALNIGGEFHYSGNDSLPTTDPNYNADGVENYDSPTQGYNRTGGDKWMLPAFVGKLAGILGRFSTPPQIPRWQVNDMSRINGGSFPGHAEHHSGVDADIQFKEFISGGKEILFDFDKLNTDQVRWKLVLDEIETFLDGISNEYKFIRNIYLSRSLNSNSIEFVNKRFENRCFKGRYIRFGSEWGQGSLLNDVATHHNHLHISFFWPRANGQMREIDLDTKDLEKLDFDDFEFSLDSTGANLTVTPLNENNFSGKQVLWRFQDAEEFSKTDMVVSFGKWPAPPPQVPESAESLIGGRKKNSTKRYIYLSIANENGVPMSERNGKYRNGACVERKVALDLNKSLNGKSWRYQKTGGKLEVVIK